MYIKSKTKTKLNYGYQRNQNKTQVRELARFDPQQKRYVGSLR